MDMVVMGGLVVWLDHIQRPQQLQVVQICDLSVIEPGHLLYDHRNLIHIEWDHPCIITLAVTTLLFGFLPGLRGTVLIGANRLELSLEPGCLMALPLLNRPHCLPSLLIIIPCPWCDGLLCLERWGLLFGGDYPVSACLVVLLLLFVQFRRDGGFGGSHGLYEIAVRSDPGLGGEYLCEGAFIVSGNNGLIINNTR